MKLFPAFLLFPLICLSQTITPTFPDVPGSTSVYADTGDLTYCQAAAVKGTVPSFTLTCRRAGATYLISTVIKSPGVVTNGDIAWLFSWDQFNPKLVHVQASTNTRDPSIVVAVITWPNPLPAEFQMGELVKDSTGLKSGTVLHWSHQWGSIHEDGVTNSTFNAQISLSNVTGSFVMGDSLVGQNTGAVGLIGSTIPITSRKLKSAFDADWTIPPAPAVQGIFRRIFGVFR